MCCKSQSIPLFGRHAVFRFDVVGDLGILPRTCAQREVISDRDEPVEQLPDALKVIVRVRKLHEAHVVIVLRFFHHVFEDAAFAVERGVEHGAGDAARFADIIDGHVVISAALKEGNGCFRDFLFEFPGRILHFKHP